MKITLLGTSCMVPTKERNVSSTYVAYDGEGILFDCGEGTQRQMNIAGIKRSSVKKICITHWHADHIAGILGLLQTISQKEQEVTLKIFGPVETKKRMKHLLETSISYQYITLEIIELAPTKKETLCYENADYALSYISLDHTTPCVGYKLRQKDKRRIKVEALQQYNIKPGPILSQIQQGKSVTIQQKRIHPDDVSYIVPGKSIVYGLDTAYCTELIELATNADILITEATYTQKHEENARLYKHMTSQQAAQIAQLANVQRLYLVHLSQRYKTTQELLDEAQTIFPKTEIGYDFLTIKV